MLGPVFRAHDATHDRLVAIKVFKLDLLPEVASRLAEHLRELAGADCAHPALVRLVDAGLDHGTPYVVMDYATGESLDVWLRQAGPVPADRALQLLSRVAEALDASWGSGAGHGNLHPRDILVSGDDVLVSGAGIVRALEAVGARVPPRRPYTAPERANGATWDRRADVYSLGAVARDLLPGQRLAGVAEADDETIQRALADDPAERFSSAAEFVAAFSAAVVPRVERGRGQRVARVVARPSRSRGRVAEPELLPGLAPETAVEAGQARPGSSAAEATDYTDASADLAADLPLRPIGRVADPPPALPAGHEGPPSARFPWSAVAAVALAGIVLGGAAGYRFGFSRGADATVAALVNAGADPDPVELPPASLPTDGQVAAPPAWAAVEEAAPKEGISSPGSLLVDSRPRGARVTLDGRVIGRTPSRVPGMLPGDHRVLIDLTGYQRVTSTVKIVAGEQTRLAVTLEETSGASRRSRNDR